MMDRRYTIADYDFRPKNQMDYCMELNRSVSLFLAISTLLAMSAMLVLFAFNDDPINDILLITPENSHTLYRIPYSFRVIHVVTFLLGMFVTACGIYGYARLNRYALSYYGLSLVLVLLWFIYFIIVVSNRDDTDVPRQRFFLDFKFSRNARHSAYILQNMYQCCGSKFYNYEDMEALPKSCCQQVSDDFNCFKESKWEKQCETNRTTLFSHLQQSKKLFNIACVCAAACAVLVSAIFKIALSSTLLTLQHKVDARLSSHCIFTLINGCVLLLLSIFGYCGISKQRIWMLKMFLFASLIITIIHTMLAVIAFATVYKMDGSKTKIAIARIFARYDIDQRHKKQVDDIQIELMCCGVEGPHSWKTKIPDSCCHIVRNDICDEHSAYKTSCSDVLVASYKKYKWILAIEATTTATGAVLEVLHSTTK